MKNRFGVLAVLLLFPVSRYIFANDGTVSRTVLDNGITLVIQQDTSSRTSAVRIFIRGGQAAEPEGFSGLAFLTTRLCLEIPDQHKVQALMDQATRLTMSSQEDFTQVSLACLSEYLDDSLSLTAELLRKPLFSSIRIDRIKDFMIRRGERALDDPETESHLAFRRYFFGGSPLGGLTYGDESSLRNIRKRHITEFYETHFLTGHMVVAVISDLNSEELAEKIKTYLGALTKGNLPSPAPQAFPTREAAALDVGKQTLQSLIAVGFMLPPLDRRVFLLSTLLDTLLGKGVGSRLWPLRTELKLAYNVNTRLTSFRSGGLLEAYLETDSGRKEEALAALIDLLDDLHREGVTEDELAVTQAFAQTRFLSDNETKDGRAGTLGWMEAMGLGTDLFPDFHREIESVTPDELNDFIRKWLDPSRRVVVVVGPGQDQRPG